MQYEVFKLTIQHAEAQLRDPNINDAYRATLREYVENARKLLAFM